MLLLFCVAFFLFIPIDYQLGHFFFLSIVCLSIFRGVYRYCVFFFFSSRRRHTRLQGDWSSDVCSSDLVVVPGAAELGRDDFPAGFIPNLRLSGTTVHSRIPRGQWRAVEDSSTVFVSQTFVDELAHLAGRDPLAFRLELLGEPREVPYYDTTYHTGRLRAV